MRNYHSKMFEMCVNVKLEYFLTSFDVYLLVMNWCNKLKRVILEQLNSPRNQKPHPAHTY